ncbi:hypothetical protein T459_22906 [Capsicum annuum]|uniref:Uncharacterized protein n=1 Tax=Capsicum annuum TaxID=4072 RepID=A0A2G2YR75_CAPAN|nr:hypothetical protein T459_22906 [Capsicum annuum]
MAHHSLNGSSKRLRIEGGWDEKPLDLGSCMDQVQQLMMKARMIYEAKEQNEEHINITQQIILNELFMHALFQSVIRRSSGGKKKQLIVGLISFQGEKMLRMITGRPGPSGFGSATTAEQVTEGIDGSNLTPTVTGGASGIVLETARVLTLRNIYVMITARNMEAANEAKQCILKDNKAARVDIEKLDLSSIRFFKGFSDNFIELNLPLNILM